MNFLLIILCISLGVILKNAQQLPSNSHKAINSWLMNIAIPAVALKYLPKIVWNYELIVPMLMPVIIWLGAVLVINLVDKYFVHMNKASKAGLILVSGLSNTSFIGFPITQAWYGDAGLEIAVLCDQACFIVMAVFGVTFAAQSKQKEKMRFNNVVFKLITFPPFIAALAAITLSSYVDFSKLSVIVDSLAATVIPLALFSVGLQLSLKNWKDEIPLISIGLAYKLVIAPLIILAIVFIFSISGITAKVSILEAAMAPMITGAIIATDYDLDPKLANIVLGLGIPISFVSTAIWQYLLNILL